MKLNKISTIIGLSLMMTINAAMAEDPKPPVSVPKVNATPEQGHGTVTFKGAIIEAPCSIAADSVDQTVQLGQVSTTQLKAGTSSPRMFDIKLEGCDITAKKTVTATFSGVSSSSTGDALALMGGTAAGAGIHINDSTGTPIKIGAAAGEGNKTNLQAGTTTLHYSAFLKAIDTTGAGLKTGDFTSVATFNLSYQ
ncbi:fimbrial protein [Enterobacter bugandensis]|uniref:fimbrial protein n=1 Tax=Enterobacter bugandensis TaxID=881260 RepID=UPI0020042077|nr:fimbrial protein [Enterobacter bugandensis]MCK6964559.1 type 1 fimbrial protein [Enterobacter bugandensis]